MLQWFACRVVVQLVPLVPHTLNAKRFFHSDFSAPMRTRNRNSCGEPTNNGQRSTNKPAVLRKHLAARNSNPTPVITSFIPEPKRSNFSIEKCKNHEERLNE